MAILPKAVYRQTEKQLRDRWKMLPRARQKLYRAQQQVYSVHGAQADFSGGSHPGNADRLSAGALRILQAEEDVQRAEAWMDVFRMMDRTFPFESTSEGLVAGLLYGNGMTVEEVCRATGSKRTTVIHRRDNYVCHCALFAAAAGLIQIREDEHDADR